MLLLSTPPALGLVQALRYHAPTACPWLRPLGKQALWRKSRRSMGNRDRSRKHIGVNRRTVTPPVIAHELLVFIRRQPRLPLQSAKGNGLLLGRIGDVFQVERKAGFPPFFSHTLQKLRFAVHFA